MVSVTAVSAWQVLVAVAIWAAVLVPAVVTGLKGHWALLGAGILVLGLVWLIAAFRLARPNSYWARRFYSPEKLERSQARYPGLVPS
jgi:heme O synthase-like polyprenyltransferase